MPDTSHPRSLLQIALSALSVERLQKLARSHGLKPSKRKSMLIAQLEGTGGQPRDWLDSVSEEEFNRIIEAIPIPLIASRENLAVLLEAERKGRKHPPEVLPWTLRVEGLGKIRRASIHPRPLMVLVGDNNSGKSYLVSLLWGLLARPALSLTRLNRLPAFRKAIQRMSSLLQEANPEGGRELDARDYRALFGWFSEALSKGKDEFVRSLFNSHSVSLDSLEIQLSLQPRTLWIERGEMPPGNQLLLTGANHYLGLRMMEEAGPGDALLYMLGALVFGLKPITDAPPVVPLWPNELFEQAVAFLPASRTGFMLSYKALVKRQLEQMALLAGPQRPPVPLSLPIVSFLQRIAIGETGDPGPFAVEAAFLERAALGGKLEVRSNVGGNEFVYHPEGADRPVDMSLAMHLTSSLVTELAPLIYILRYSKDLRFLILEEPEAHLHPRLQRRLAQVLVRLVRRGVNVWLTTHSENFCQQINNFIKLGTHPQRAEMQAELGYQEMEFLLPEEVGAYQFSTVDGMSEVTELESTAEGIAMPSFNEELYSLARESQRLDETREDA